MYGNPIGETDSLDDPALLMEVMEAREELEDAETEEEVERVKVSNAGTCLRSSSRTTAIDPCWAA